MQREEGVWIASEMHLLLMRNTAAASEENAWPETSKGTDVCACACAGVCVCVHPQKTASGRCANPCNLTRCFHSHNLAWKPARPLPASTPQLFP